MAYKTAVMAVVLCALIVVITAPSGMSRVAWTRDSSEGPVCTSYTLPDGDLWTSTGFPVEVCLSDSDGIDTAYLLSLENDTWVRWHMVYHYRLNETTAAYKSLYPFLIDVPPPGLTVNYTFRFEANDTLGNMAYTDNITTSIYRGEGPVFVDYWFGEGDIDDNGHSGCRVEVADPDGIDTVQLHIWNPHTESWSAKVMSYEQDTPAGEEYVCLYNITAPYNEPPAIYKFRLEANDSLGNSVLSCELSIWYMDIITTAGTSDGHGWVPPPEVLACATIIPAGIVAIVVLYMKRRP